MRVGAFPTCCLASWKAVEVSSEGRVYRAGSDAGLGLHSMHLPFCPTHVFSKSRPVTTQGRRRLRSACQKQASSQMPMLRLFVRSRLVDPRSAQALCHRFWVQPRNSGHPWPMPKGSAGCLKGTSGKVALLSAAQFEFGGIS